MREIDFKKASTRKAEGLFIYKDIKIIDQMQILMMTIEPVYGLVED